MEEEPFIAQVDENLILIFGKKHSLQMKNLLRDKYTMLCVAMESILWIGQKKQYFFF